MESLEWSLRESSCPPAHAMHSSSCSSKGSSNGSSRTALSTAQQRLIMGSRSTAASCLLRHTLLQMPASSAATQRQLEELGGQGSSSTAQPLLVLVLQGRLLLPLRLQLLLLLLLPVPLLALPALALHTCLVAWAMQMWRHRGSCWRDTAGEAKHKREGQALPPSKLQEALLQ